MADGMCFLFLVFCSIAFVNCELLCDSSYCEDYIAETGCTFNVNECQVNNATFRGMWLPSPTMCNCCPFCLPMYGEGEQCSLGGPGLGTTVGRCAEGLTCENNVCVRMSSPCHSAQDDFDDRHTRGTLGALEQRPQCDDKAKYGPYHCVPTQTCFCQNEDGDRIFGEVFYEGTVTMQNMHCGCSRLHEKIKNNIQPSLPFPVVGPRCTADGNFYHIQCMEKQCYCVNTVTGLINNEKTIHLDSEPVSNLPCYDRRKDLYPEQSTGEPPYAFTTACIKALDDRKELLQESIDAGFNIDFFTSIHECMPDGTYGRIEVTTNGTKICVDEAGQQIENYEALPDTTEFNSMDCNCALTALLMKTSTEKPVCCKNGNFRRIQCRRGLCRCVDSEGRQIGLENADITRLSCYTVDWRSC